MKKCPKCGTILDDSKKKCYMCGTELAKTSANFAESFNIKVGAQTTKGQDNVFNNGKNFNECQAQRDGFHDADDGNGDICRAC